MTNQTSNVSPKFDVLVCHTEVGYIIAYVWDWDQTTKRYSKHELKAIWKELKAMAKSDYGYHNSIIGSGVCVNVSNDSIKDEHLAIAAPSFDMSYAKQSQL